ncbi:DNA-formamidopyrimidine glycosylase family protein [Mobilicoccus sp.]|uniref:DNA-formamidopyrimidine glycosylase family protein n=1 Tax=Mobilicoccus sp. TaxID=2034349 RepID=UPI0028A9742B|nr:DNA-formamidopyrimidine glycosylase family protein [Mobilicoccus sp.]
MPEGDTVLRTARRLHAAFAGAQLTRAELRWGERDADVLVGVVTSEVVARGKHLLHRVEGGWTLHSHLRMEGSWRITAASEPVPRRGDIRAVLSTGRWTGLGLRLGMLDLLRTDDEHRLVGHLGPDVLGADWDEDLAVAHVLPSRATIGAAMLDQRNLAGVGTMYCSEALFLEATQPWTPAADLGEDAVRRVVRRAHRLLHANVEHAVQSTTGSRRQGESVYVHARSGHACRRCRTLVRVAMIGTPPQERTMFYCPTCQGGLAPTDDGGRQRPLGTGPAKRRRGYVARGRG